MVNIGNWLKTQMQSYLEATWNQPDAIFGNLYSESHLVEGPIESESIVSDDVEVNGTLETGSVSTEEASINGPLDAESATVEQASIGGTGADLQWELIETVSDPSGAEVSFSEFDDFDRYRIRMNALASGTSGEIRLLIGSAGSGDYTYWDETGTKQTGENHILILDSNSGFAFFSADIWLSENASGETGVGRIEVSPSRPGRVDGFGIAGGTDASAPDSITIDDSADDLRDGGEIKLYGADN